jgi:hypothetical protein
MISFRLFFESWGSLDIAPVGGLYFGLSLDEIRKLVYSCARFFVQIV